MSRAVLDPFLDWTSLLSEEFLGCLNFKKTQTSYKISFKQAAYTNLPPRARKTREIPTKETQS